MRLCVAVLLFLGLYGLPGFIRAETVHKATEGGNITVECQFYRATHTKLFCKNNCDKENILVKTSGYEQCEGRYCIQYKYNGFLRDMYVSITNVTSADSGHYQCVLRRNFSLHGSHTFRIDVTKKSQVTVKPTTDMDLTVQTGDQTSLMSVTTTQQSTTSSDHDLQTNTSESWFLLLLTLIPVVLITLCALVFYRKRKVQNDKGAKDEVVMYENCPAPPSEPEDST
ncbi:uncharacterized protein LOC129412382 isoform X2 [Boleophthalmus pectinirostris]|uniref:uncharacterized protein LOC129412382 isoform X2 n=1 Tax=Boleophthalmus pectinirostris TaxID=150288 RepID=UPI002432039D|nr:uncharacterized protein LOC129412382 isoform X2 [Boleophthalmus pectinirostris]